MRSKLFRPACSTGSCSYDQSIADLEISHPIKVVNSGNFKVLFLSMVLLMLSNAGHSQNTSQPAKISSDGCSLIVDGNHSARIISFKCKDHELLTSREVHDFNYGSTLWPSPDAIWGQKWPPPVHLDGKSYKRLETASEDTLAFESEVDSITGLVFTKKFYFNQTDENLSIQYTATNTTDTAVQVALWEVTRVPGALSFFPVPANRKKISSFRELKSTYEESGIFWYQFDQDSSALAQKTYQDGTEGWLAHWDERKLFIKVFEEVAEDELPPNHGEVEIYTHVNGAYVELENHSPLQVLQPGAAFTYSVKWYYRILGKKHASTRDKDRIVQEVRNIIKKNG